jgi:hypothetical protein
MIEKRFHPRNFGWARGNELGADDVSPEVAVMLRDWFYQKSINHQKIFKNSCSKIYTNRLRERTKKKIHEVFLSRLVKPKKIRLVEKTPKNCLRVRFLDKIFPDAFYIFLTRDPRTNISSLMEGWRHLGRFETYDLPLSLEIEGYEGNLWKFLLPPGWRKYCKGVRLEEVCAFQYEIANRMAAESLENISNHRHTRVWYEDLIRNPEKEIRRICDKVGLDYSGGLRKWAMKMPPVNTCVAPDVNKWKKNADEVMSVINRSKGLRNLLRDASTDRVMRHRTPDA